MSYNDLSDSTITGSIKTKRNPPLAASAASTESMRATDQNDSRDSYIRGVGPEWNGEAAEFSGPLPKRSFPDKLGKKMKRFRID